MDPSLRRAPRLTRALTSPLLLVALLLAGVLGVVASGMWVARADAQPSLTVSVKSGTDTQTTYTVVAANFPASATLTETFGDGSEIAPTTGQTDASGSMTRYWTLDVANTYCGSISASSGTAQASASFWVAPTSDTRSGTACDGGGGTASPTPNATATAAAQPTTAATAVPTQTPLAQPTTAPSSGTGSGGLIQRVLGSRLLLLVAGGAIALLVIILLLVAVAAATRKPEQRKSGQQSSAWGGSWNASPSGRQPAQGWRQVDPGTARYRQPYAPGAGPRHEAPQAWQQPPRGTSDRAHNRMPGAGQADPRWRIMGDEERGRPEGTPDPRWSRSQPGARGGRGPAPTDSSGRIRTLRDFTEHRQSVRPPGYDDRGR